MQLFTYLIEIHFKSIGYQEKMPQSRVGSMQGSNEWTHRGGRTHPQCNPTSGNTYFHTGGGRTHNLPQQTDTHIFTGGGRTQNVTQRTDTQILF